MSNKTLNAVNAASTLGLTGRQKHFVRRMYDVSDKRTLNKWTDQFIDAGLIDTKPKFTTTNRANSN